MKVSEKRGRGRGREVKSRSERGKKAISAVFPRPLCWSFPELVVPSRFTPPHKKKMMKKNGEKRNQKKGKCRGWRGLPREFVATLVISDVSRNFEEEKR